MAECLRRLQCSAAALQGCRPRVGLQALLFGCYITSSLIKFQLPCSDFRDPFVVNSRGNVHASLGHWQGNLLSLYFDKPPLQACRSLSRVLLLQMPEMTT